MGLLYGETAARLVSQRIQGQVPDTTTLASTYRVDAGGTGGSLNDGMLVVVGSGSTYNLWVFSSTSSASAGASVVVPGDSPTSGRWLKIL